MADRRYRFLLVLSVLIAMAVSGCAVGVRQPASAITKTSAVLNGKVLSTTGGGGSHHFEYGSAGLTQQTQTSSIDFDAGESQPVSESVNGLEPGREYSFRVCAEDGENPGEPFCSPNQTFRTPYDVKLDITELCDSEPGVRVEISGLPPDSLMTVDPPGAPPITFPTNANPDGTLHATMTEGDAGNGTWTITVAWSGGSVTKSLLVDCQTAS